MTVAKSGSSSGRNGAVSKAGTAKGGTPATAKPVLTQELDDILDQALDDLEEQALQDKIRRETLERDEEKARFERESADTKRREEEAKIREMLASMNDPTFGATLQKTLKSLSSTSEGMETVDDFFDNVHQSFEHDHEVRCGLSEMMSSKQILISLCLIYSRLIYRVDQMI